MNFVYLCSYSRKKCLVQYVNILLSTNENSKNLKYTIKISFSIKLQFNLNCVFFFQMLPNSVFKTCGNPDQSQMGSLKKIDFFEA